MKALNRVYEVKETRPLPRRYVIAVGLTLLAGGAIVVAFVLMLAGQEMVKKGLSLAAEQLEAAAADIEFVNGSYRIKGTDRAISLRELARQRAGELDIAYANKFGATFPNGCHIAEVEVDPDTGATEVVSYCAVDDIGTVINHAIVEGQLHGGMVQGAGQVFGEKMIYDPQTGQPLTGSFMAFSSARCRRLTRITFACTRRTPLMAIP